MSQKKLADYYTISVLTPRTRMVKGQPRQYASRARLWCNGCGLPRRFKSVREAMSYILAADCDQKPEVVRELVNARTPKQFVATVLVNMPVPCYGRARGRSRQTKREVLLTCLRCGQAIRFRSIKQARDHIRGRFGNACGYVVRLAPTA